MQLRRRQQRVVGLNFPSEAEKNRDAFEQATTAAKHASAPAEYCVPAVNMLITPLMLLFIPLSGMLSKENGQKIEYLDDLYLRRRCPVGFAGSEE